VAHGLVVDAGSVRCGDQLLVGGQALTVVDMAALPRGGRRLTFGTGETFTMGPATVVWATRTIPVRR
ncbi:hypothetical protein D7231_34845, partial [Streptomyces klenkii]